MSAGTGTKRPRAQPSISSDAREKSKKKEVAQDSMTRDKQTKDINKAREGEGNGCSRIYCVVAMHALQRPRSLRGDLDLNRNGFQCNYG